MTLPRFFLSALGAVLLILAALNCPRHLLLAGCVVLAIVLPLVGWLLASLRKVGRELDDEL